MICPNCNQEINEKANFCRYCGFRFEAKQKESKSEDAKKPMFRTKEERQAESTHIVFSNYESSRTIIEWVKYATIILAILAMLAVAWVYDFFVDDAEPIMSLILGVPAFTLVRIIGFNICNQMKVRFDIAETLQYIAVQLTKMNQSDQSESRFEKIYDRGEDEDVLS